MDSVMDNRPDIAVNRRQLLGWGSGLMALAAFAPCEAQAALPNLWATPTDLTSSADRMISYRFQDRMWQTPDGGTHLIVNRGSLSPGAALTMCSSYDNGRTWALKLALADTDHTSTCDGILNGNELNLVYSNPAGQIRQTSLAYDPGALTWTAGEALTVFAAEGTTAMSPSLVRDNIGAQWCSFVTQNDATLETALELAFRNRSATSTWGDTGLVFGAIDNVEDVERAGCLVRLANGVGMFYTWHDDIWWATRTDGSPIVSEWTHTLLWRSDPPGSGHRGKWGGHFSIAADDIGNLHVATVDDGRIVYFRYIEQTGLWDPMIALTGSIGAAYTQITYCAGRLVIVGNVQSQARSFQSDDLGASFRATANLRHPASGGSGIDYSSPLLESPSISRNPIPVLQLYSQGGVNKLMRFEVPLAR